MNNTRMAILGVASLAGIGCVGVLLHGMAGAKAPAPVVAAPVDLHPMVRVLVAKRDLNVGDRVQASDMGWQSWPQEALNPSFVTDGAAAKSVASPGQLKATAGKLADAAKDAMSNPADGPGASFMGAIVREKILTNEPIIQAKLVRAGGSGIMAVTLDPGMRAVALPLTPESAAGGFILPGDHVDVLLTRQVDTSNNPALSATRGFVTTTVMKNIRIMAVDQNTGPQKTSAYVGATATVEATPKQAEYLVLAKAAGNLTLMLRSYADTQGPAQIGAMTQQDAHGPMTVRVFRNSAPTAVTVNQ